MIDHLTLPVSNYAAAKTFYNRTLAPLGITPLYILTGEKPGTTPHTGYGTTSPVFWIAPATKPTAPIHLAFTAATRTQVDAFHQAALSAGAQDNGPPGPRPHYSPTYYGAFVLDADGNNIEAVCHTAP